MASHDPGEPESKNACGAEVRAHERSMSGRIMHKIDAKVTCLRCSQGALRDPPRPILRAAWVNPNENRVLSPGPGGSGIPPDSRPAWVQEGLPERQR